LLSYVPLLKTTGQPAINVPLFWNFGQVADRHQFLTRFGDEWTPSACGGAEKTRSRGIAGCRRSRNMLPNTAKTPHSPPLPLIATSHDAQIKRKIPAKIAFSATC
jgi:hypothetical protein